MGWRVDTTVKLGISCARRSQDKTTRRKDTRVISIERITDLREVAQHLNGTPKLLTRLSQKDLFNHASRLLSGVFDFDGTLTPGSQWRAVGNLLSDELRVMDMDHYRWYHSREKATRMDLSHPDWWIGQLQEGNRLAVDGAWAASMAYMLRSMNVTRSQVENAGAQLPPREGALDLLKIIHRRVVISFGIEQVILGWLLFNRVPTPVAATRLLFDQDDRVKGCHLNVVGSLSKEFAVSRFRTLSGVREMEMLVVGDSVVDASMMLPQSFNVLLMPPGEADKTLAAFRENNLEDMWDRLSLILVSDSLAPLTELIRTARDPNP